MIRIWAQRVFLLLVAFIPVYYASAYASYRDVFPEPADEPAPNSEST